MSAGPTTLENAQFARIPIGKPRRRKAKNLVQGLGFRVEGVGFGVEGLGFRV